MDLTIFIAITAAALLLQAGVLLAMFVALRRTNAQLEVFASEWRAKILPTVAIAYSILTEVQPKLEHLSTNLSESSDTLRKQVERLDGMVNDAIDRARLQVIRADELVSRTIDRVEDTTEVVHKTVISPVRQLAGLVQGVTTAVEFLVGSRRHRRNGANVSQDEMFI